MSIFNPQDRKSISGQNPQSGGNNVGIGRQVINAIFGRFPLFYNAGLSEEIAPVVDTTLYYPLTNTFAFQRQAVTALNTFVWQPPTDKHWVISFANAQANLPIITTRVVAEIDGPHQLGIVIVDQSYDGGANSPHVMPVIGGISSVLNVVVAANPVFCSYQGIKSIYLGPAESLAISIANATIGGDNFSFIRYLELPSNQPFGSGLTL